MRSSELRTVAVEVSQREDGQTMAEYGVVMAVITVASVGVFTVLSGGVITAVERVIGFLPT